MPLRFFLPAPVSQPVQAEQIRLLYHQGLTIQLLGILTGVVAVLMLRDVASHFHLFLWFLAHLTISLLRLALTTRFNRHPPEGGEAIRRWGWLYVAGTTISGVVWAALSLFYDATWPLPYQIMLFVIYTGITAGTFTTNGSYFPAFPSFYILPVGALAYVTLTNDQAGSTALGMLLCIYIVLLYMTALRFNNRLAQSLALRFENERLVEELAESNRKLRYLADVDELTGIANRRFMDAALEREWNRHRNAQAPLSLLFIDLDYFKQFNDTFGHAAGDRCLIRFAGLLRAQAEQVGELVARFGGEEFVVILPETNRQQAIDHAEAIRVELESLAIPHRSSAVAEIVTTSIGVSTLIPAGDCCVAQFRQTADRALYQAKHGGRNRVVWLPCADKLLACRVCNNTADTGHDKEITTN